MRHATRRFWNDATEDVAGEYGDPGKRLIQRKEGHPLGLAADLSEERTAEDLQDDHGERKGAGRQHGDQRPSHQGQHERCQHRDDSASQEKRAITDPVGHGGERESNQEQGHRGKRIEEADDVIGKAERAHIEVEHEVEDRPPDPNEQGEGQEVLGRRTEGSEPGQRPSDGYRYRLGEGSAD